MTTLSETISTIKSNIADINLTTIYGKTSQELVFDIIKKIEKNEEE